MSSHSVHEFNEVVRPVQKLVFKRPYIIIIANASAHLVYQFHCFPEMMNKFKRIAGYTFKYEPFFVRRGGGGGGGRGGGGGVFPVFYGYGNIPCIHGCRWSSFARCNHN